MATKKVSQSTQSRPTQETELKEKSDQQEQIKAALKVLEVISPRTFYITSDQVESIRHLALAAQGIRREFENLELDGVAGLFGGFQEGLSTLLESVESQRIEGGSE